MDTEVLNAVRPALATTGGPLIIISSPFGRHGEAYQTWKDHFGPNGDPRILVLQGASRDFNASLPQSVIDKAMARDPAAASAEYLGQWRNDLESYVNADVVTACTIQGRFELPHDPREAYAAFVDPSSGLGADSMTLCIGHRREFDGVVVIDLVRECRPPFEPSTVVEEFAAVMRSYGIQRAVSDRYSLGWTRESFEQRGIRLEWSSKSAATCTANFSRC